MPNTITLTADEVVLRLSIEDAQLLRDRLAVSQHRDPRETAIMHMLTLNVEQAIRRASATHDIEQWVNSREPVRHDTLLPAHLLDPWANGDTERPFDPTDQDPT